MTDLPTFPHWPFFGLIFNFAKADLQFRAVWSGCYALKTDPLTPRRSLWSAVLSVAVSRDTCGYFRSATAGMRTRLQPVVRACRSSRCAQSFLR